MLQSVEAVYRDGKIEFLEKPPEVKESRVIVTFLPARRVIDLRERGIDEAQATDLHARLAPFAEDWNRPEMDVYDEVKAKSS